MASLLKHLSERWSRNGRPRLVHLMPWDLTVGGAQRMLDVWCSHEAHRWDTHILTVGARGPFAFASATVHSELASSEIMGLIETLQPELLVHHEPSDQNGILTAAPKFGSCTARILCNRCHQSMRDLQWCSRILTQTRFIQVGGSCRSKCCHSKSILVSFVQPAFSMMVSYAALWAAYTRTKSHALSSKRF